MDRDEWIEIIIMIIIITIILTIFGLVFFFFFTNQSGDNNNHLFGTEPGFMQVCVQNSCPDGYECDAGSFYCKLSDGKVCENFGDCLTGHICSGVCYAGPTGSFKKACPCNSGLICQSNPGKLSVCLKPAFESCNDDSDCYSNFCNMQFCEPAPNSYPCQSNDQCQSNFCNLGFCQNQNNITGQLGSACAGDCVEFSGAGCNTGLMCRCVDEIGPGVCSTYGRGILNPCNDISNCSTSLTCIQNDGTECNNTNCVCMFPYPIPNEIESPETCIQGMTFQNGVCRNNSLIGCEINSDCQSNSCNSNSSLTQINFGVFNNDQNRGTNFIGSNNPNLHTTFDLNSNIKNVIRLFSESNQELDTIYFVDSNSGLWRAIYNPITGNLNSELTNIIPKNRIIGNSNFSLIDVNYNQQQFIVAFTQTQNSTSYDVLYSGSNLTDLNPHNVQAGIGFPGTQYYSGNPISISSISISPSNPISSGNDLLIVNSSNQLLINSYPYNQNYQLAIITGGPMSGMTVNTKKAEFYYDITINPQSGINPVCPSQDNLPILCPSNNNFAFVGPFRNCPACTNYPNVLQFSGNAAGSSFPISPLDPNDINYCDYHVLDFSIYSSSENGMIDSSIIMITQNSCNNVANNHYTISISRASNNIMFPMIINQNSKSLVTKNAFYIFSRGTCN